jgi:hypothetical protein
MTIIEPFPFLATAYYSTETDFCQVGYGLKNKNWLILANFYFIYLFLVISLIKGKVVDGF